MASFLRAGKRKLASWVSSVLSDILADFIKGLTKDSLTLQLGAGSIRLTQLQVQPHALQALHVPATVKSGTIGELQLKINLWALAGGGGRHSVLAHDINIELESLPSDVDSLFPPHASAESIRRVKLKLAGPVHKKASYNLLGVSVHLKRVRILWSDASCVKGYESFEILFDSVVAHGNQDGSWDVEIDGLSLSIGQSGGSQETSNSALPSILRPVSLKGLARVGSSGRLLMDLTATSHASIKLSTLQAESVLHLLDMLSSFRSHQLVWAFRPRHRPTMCPRRWWKYAFNVVVHRARENKAAKSLAWRYVKAVVGLSKKTSQSKEVKSAWASQLPLEVLCACHESARRMIAIACKDTGEELLMDGYAPVTGEGGEDAIDEDSLDNDGVSESELQAKLSSYWRGVAGQDDVHGMLGRRIADGFGIILRFDVCQGQLQDDFHTFNSVSGRESTSPHNYSQNSSQSSTASCMHLDLCKLKIIMNSNEESFGIACSSSSMTGLWLNHGIEQTSPVHHLFDHWCSDVVMEFSKVSTKSGRSSSIVRLCNGEAVVTPHLIKFVEHFTYGLGSRPTSLPHLQDKPSEQKMLSHANKPTTKPVKESSWYCLMVYGCSLLFPAGGLDKNHFLSATVDEFVMMPASANSRNVEEQGYRSKTTSPSVGVTESNRSATANQGSSEESHDFAEKVPVQHIEVDDSATECHTDTMAGCLCCPISAPQLFDTVLVNPSLPIPSSEIFSNLKSKNVANVSSTSDTELQGEDNAMSMLHKLANPFLVECSSSLQTECFLGSCKPESKHTAISSNLMRIQISCIQCLELEGTVGDTNVLAGLPSGGEGNMLQNSFEGCVLMSTGKSPDQADKVMAAHLGTLDFIGNQVQIEQLVRNAMSVAASWSSGSEEDRHSAPLHPTSSASTDSNCLWEWLTLSPGHSWTSIAVEEIQISFVSSQQPNVAENHHAKDVQNCLWRSFGTNFDYASVKSKDASSIGSTHFQTDQDHDNMAAAGQNQDSQEHSLTLTGVTLIQNRASVCNRDLSDPAQAQIFSVCSTTWEDGTNNFFVPSDRGGIVSIKPACLLHQDVSAWKAVHSYSQPFDQLFGQGLRESEGKATTAVLLGTSAFQGNFDFANRMVSSISSVLSATAGNLDLTKPEKASSHSKSCLLFGGIDAHIRLSASLGGCNTVDVECGHSQAQICQSGDRIDFHAGFSQGHAIFPSSKYNQSTCLPKYKIIWKLPLTTEILFWRRHGLRGSETNGSPNPSLKPLVRMDCRELEVFLFVADGNGPMQQACTSHHQDVQSLEDCTSNSLKMNVHQYISSIPASITLNLHLLCLNVLSSDAHKSLTMKLKQFSVGPVPSNSFPGVAKSISMADGFEISCACATVMRAPLSHQCLSMSSDLEDDCQWRPITSFVQNMKCVVSSQCGASSFPSVNVSIQADKIVALLNLSNASQQQCDKNFSSEPIQARSLGLQRFISVLQQLDISVSVPQVEAYVCVSTALAPGNIRLLLTNVTLQSSVLSEDNRSRHGCGRGIENAICRIDAQADASLCISGMLPRWVNAVRLHPVLSVDVGRDAHINLDLQGFAVKWGYLLNSALQSGIFRVAMQRQITKPTDIAGARIDPSIQERVLASAAFQPVFKSLPSVTSTSCPLPHTSVIQDPFCAVLAELAVIHQLGLVGGDTNSPQEYSDSRSLHKLLVANYVDTPVALTLAHASGVTFNTFQLLAEYPELYAFVSESGTPGHQVHDRNVEPPCTQDMNCSFSNLKSCSLYTLDISDHPRSFTGACEAMMALPELNCMLQFPLNLNGTSSTEIEFAIRMLGEDHGSSNPICPIAIKMVFVLGSPMLVIEPKISLVNSCAVPIFVHPNFLTVDSPAISQFIHIPPYSARRLPIQWCLGWSLSFPPRAIWNYKQSSPDSPHLQILPFQPSSDSDVVSNGVNFSLLSSPVTGSISSPSLQQVWNIESNFTVTNLLPTSVKVDFTHSSNDEGMINKKRVFSSGEIQPMGCVPVFLDGKAGFSARISLPSEGMQGRRIVSLSPTPQDENNGNVNKKFIRQWRAAIVCSEENQATHEAREGNSLINSHAKERLLQTSFKIFMEIGRRNDGQTRMILRPQAVVRSQSRYGWNRFYGSNQARDSRAAISSRVGDWDCSLVPLSGIVYARKTLKSGSSVHARIDTSKVTNREQCVSTECDDDLDPARKFAQDNSSTYDLFSWSLFQEEPSGGGGTCWFHMGRRFCLQPSRSMLLINDTGTCNIREISSDSRIVAHAQPGQQIEICIGDRLVVTDSNARNFPGLFLDAWTEQHFDKALECLGKAGNFFVGCKTLREGCTSSDPDDSMLVASHLSICFKLDRCSTDDFNPEETIVLRVLQPCESVLAIHSAWPSVIQASLLNWEPDWQSNALHDSSSDRLAVAERVHVLPSQLLVINPSKPYIPHALHISGTSFAARQSFAQGASDGNTSGANRQGKPWHLRVSLAASRTHNLPKDGYVQVWYRGSARPTYREGDPHRNNSAVCDNRMVVQVKHHGYLPQGGSQMAHPGPSNLLTSSGAARQTFTKDACSVSLKISVPCLSVQLADKSRVCLAASFEELGFQSTFNSDGLSRTASMCCSSIVICSGLPGTVHQKLIQIHHPRHRPEGFTSVVTVTHRPQNLCDYNIHIGPLAVIVGLDSVTPQSLALVMQACSPVAGITTILQSSMDILRNRERQRFYTGRTVVMNTISSMSICESKLEVWFARSWSSSAAISDSQFQDITKIACPKTMQVRWFDGPVCTSGQPVSENGQGGSSSMIPWLLWSLPHLRGARSSIPKIELTSDPSRPIFAAGQVVSASLIATLPDHIGSVITSSALFGDVARLARSFRSAIGEATDAVAQGARQGPVQSAVGLGRGACVIIGTGLSAVGSAARTAALSLRHDVTGLTSGGSGSGTRREEPANVLNGATSAFRSLGTGLSGLVSSPWQGASRSGIGGAMTGLVQGARGLLSAPLEGALGLTAGAAGSIAQVGLMIHGLGSSTPGDSSNSTAEADVGNASGEAGRMSPSVPSEQITSRASSGGLQGTGGSSSVTRASSSDSLPRMETEAALHTNLDCSGRQMELLTSSVTENGDILDDGVV